METRSYIYLRTPKGAIVHGIFGYCTKGVPGIEVNGCGKYGRSIKEKLIYLTKARHLSLPLQRFVLCLDPLDQPKEIPWGELRYIEFPFLVLFWSLAQLIPIKKLENCLISGSLDLEGDIVIPQSLKDQARAHGMIGIYPEEGNEGLWAGGILRSVQGMTWQWEEERTQIESVWAS